MTVILAVEHGWQGMRELSLAFAKLGASVDVLIKGRVPSEVLAMITTPRGMRVLDAPRVMFRWCLVWSCLTASLTRRPVLVVTQQWGTRGTQITRRWMERLRRIVPFELCLLEEAKGNVRLLRPDGAAISAEMAAAKGAAR